MIRKPWIIALCVLLLAVGTQYYLRRAGFLHLRPSPKLEQVFVSDGVVHSAEKAIPVSIADTAPTRERGLSFTDVLPPGTGKLFIFDTPGDYGFWMKDMLYPLDLVWIDEDFRVIGVEENVAPETYPSVFFPPQSVMYVLEVNAREALLLGLRFGAQLAFEKN